MDLATFQVKLIDYAMEEVLPSLPDVPLNLFGINIPVSPSLMRFGMGVGLTMSSMSIENFAPQLKAFGILDENNHVDADKLSAAMQAEMSKVGKVKIGGFEFDSADVDKLVSYLKS